MSLLDIMVEEALSHRPELASLRVTVEKEILHQDIIRILAEADFLKKLVFMGGTCLRLCHGSNRLSEDLDFAGGHRFDRTSLQGLGKTIELGLSRKYDLGVSVAKPEKEAGNVDTWRIKVYTRPKQRNIPAQRINLDICAVPGHEPQPQVIRDLHGVSSGIPGLIVQAESLGEIFLDKLVAFGLRRGRIKNRDMWDIGWLTQRSVSPSLHLLSIKIGDHGAKTDDFLNTFTKRVLSLQDPSMAKGFLDEMSRFLPSAIVTQTVATPPFWDWICRLMEDQLIIVRNTLKN